MPPNSGSDSKTFAACLLSSTALLWLGCAASPTDSNGGSGGTPSGSGGAASGGLANGGSSSGGSQATGTGGSTASGGANSGGAATTAGASSGGTSSSGGATSGGASSGGTATGSGGATSAGSSSGGNSSSSSGGTTSTGTSTGGTSSGGTTAKGGAASGGSSGGNASSGGASSGGSASQGGTTTSGGNSSTATPPALTTTVTLHVAGDSTAAIFPASDGRVGWASVLQQFFNSGVVVNDAALSGRSTKSYIDEGAWTTLQAKIKTGDYLFIEFGHNDEKSDDATRYTDPATTFRTNLKTFIDGARAKGGYPVLLTSICRRYFSGTTVTGTHGAYTEAVFAVGSANKVPVIDMESKTKAWLTALGPTNSIPMFATDDNTHLSAMGAPEVAKLAVAGIREFNFPIATRLK
ncbi:MAG: rhamnogalacturonan acetylesterase [Polyangiaceae bacterium]